MTELSGKLLIPLPNGYIHYVYQWMPKATALAEEQARKLEGECKILDAFLTVSLNCEGHPNPTRKLICEAMNQRWAIIQQLRDGRRHHLPMLYRSDGVA